MNSATSIKVENLSKQYRLGKVGRQTFHEDLNRWLHRIAGREDPYLKIGETNDRSLKGNSEYVWALQNINFEVQQGEVLGIIGRNGAGKSTLLKLLSKVTSPTTGSIKIKGRIASLLEVGTGFHPELSGRDNIFLNGAILGMSKREISKKLEEIIDFAGVERYINTPVKRYSSGMYVRLAFAVAAHLEPDILIVDEVLAVGDAEFQKKCLGKMRDVSVKDGRTVLFVSHNMEAITKLCPSSILLENGSIVHWSSTSEVLTRYLTPGKTEKEVMDLSLLKREKKNLNGKVRFRSVRLKRSDTAPWQLRYKEPITFEFEIEVLNNVDFFEIGLSFYTKTEHEIVSSLSSDFSDFTDIKKGIYHVQYTLKEFSLLPDSYKIGLGIRSENGFEDAFAPFINILVIVSKESAEGKASTRRGYIVPTVDCNLKMQEC